MSKTKSKDKLKISAPVNFEHRVHVGYDYDSDSFIGLPLQWAGITNAQSRKPIIYDPTQLQSSDCHNSKAQGNESLDQMHGQTSGLNNVTPMQQRQRPPHPTPNNDFNNSRSPYPPGYLDRSQFASDDSSVSPPSYHQSRVGNSPHSQFSTPQSRSQPQPQPQGQHSITGFGSPNHRQKFNASNSNSNSNRLNSPSPLAAGANVQGTQSRLAYNNINYMLSDTIADEPNYSAVRKLSQPNILPNANLAIARGNASPGLPMSSSLSDFLRDSPTGGSPNSSFNANSASNLTFSQPMAVKGTIISPSQVHETRRVTPVPPARNLPNRFASPLNSQNYVNVNSGSNSQLNPNANASSSSWLNLHQENRPGSASGSGSGSFTGSGNTYPNAYQASFEQRFADMRIDPPVEFGNENGHGHGHGNGRMQSRNPEETYGQRADSTDFGLRIDPEINGNEPMLPSPTNFSAVNCSIEEFCAVLQENCAPDDPRGILTEWTKIGEGSTATVYTAVDRANNWRVAVKRMELRKQQRRELLLSEVLVMRTLKHPNMVEMFEAYLVPSQHDPDPGASQLWLVMEYMAGGALTEIVTHCRLEETQLATICRSVLKALAYLHSNNVIHRDVKSDSILVSLDGYVKLSDFGFSAQVGQDGRRRSLVGTPYWMAPELIARVPYGSAVDIWSFGVMLVEMIDGEPPHFSLTPLNAMRQIRDHPPAPIRGMHRYSPLLAEFIALALVREPNERASASQLLEDRFIQQLAAGPSCLVPLINSLR